MMQQKLFKHSVGASSRTKVVTQAFNPSSTQNIRVCRECIHFSPEDNVCKVFSMTNHVNMKIKHMKTLHCRTREDLCGMNAKYFEPSNKVFVEEVVLDNTNNITYHIDGSVSVSNFGNSVDSYYASLHRDFDEIY